MSAHKNVVSPSFCVNTSCIFVNISYVYKNTIYVFINISCIYRLCHGKIHFHTCVYDYLP